ncbi:MULTISPECIES: efflux RND transporter permease subunit [Proteiniphilum]|jgi:multidrug efflux pump subunit AcrB|uniref:efflux RND transporter permease subunit n=1 Tax=Proteiniphilum TaxID=294702 RepID=UPI001EEB9399|nr:MULTISPECIES: efflux RND transporter permease subunit [Proteiniphilum]ULB33806.1 efflux RND transporter permease subunit [Proteiniphilum propionicum]
MIKFLLRRPIAVLMVFLACVIIGIITYNTLPVSLLPDIAIPEITVQVTGDNMSARELENTVVKPIRRQLMQTGKLRDIRSEARDGSAIVRLKFDYGTNTDLAFIEVNEKIDAAMNSLPRDLRRPRVIKASATDIPVFYLNLTLKEDKPYTPTDEQKFLDLSDFADNVVKRRIEQLPQVAMADMTGLMYRHLQIVPDLNRLESASISLNDIENTLAANNIEPGSMTVRDGYYEYNIKFSSLLRTPEDVRNIYLRKDGRIFQLKDLTKIDVVRQPEAGMSLIDGKRAVTLGVIKQADETMKSLKKSLNATLADLERTYPDVQFTVNRNQTELLDYTIANLRENLTLGLLLVFIVALLFLGDAKSPVIIGISMITALLTTFIFFYLFRQSLNIITLSGLILAVGMMIDSAIIVTDIINQYRMQGCSLEESCVKGTNEVITPVLSSTLTTIAVFVPLVFMSGIAGAIFFAQAFAVSVGLLISYFTGIIMLPVLYKLVYGMKTGPDKVGDLFARTQRQADKWAFGWYDRGIEFIFRHKTATFLFIILSVPLCVLMFRIMPRSSMPHIDHTETVAMVEWNENIHVDENKERVFNLMESTDEMTTEHAGYVGHRQYLLDKENDLSPSEAQLYFRTAKASYVEKLKLHISDWIRMNYPQAVVTFSPPENVFEKIFDTSEADVVAQLYPANREEIPDAGTIRAIERQLQAATGLEAEGIPLEQQLTITIDKEKLLLYGVDYGEVYRTLRTAFRENQIALLRSYQQYLPISLAGKQQTAEQVLRETLVQANASRNNSETMIPLQSLVSVHRGEDIKTIVAGKNGEYIPMNYYDIDRPETLIKNAEKAIRKDNTWEAQFSGSFFSNQKMLGELVVILLVSILLMYFILSSQFENFLQPLIVLIEIPIDIAFALILLWATGHTLNLMSAIGLIVSSGIIINDSILKLDMINELRKQGIPLMEAIHTAGVKRLRAIIMTSLTTILAMVPLLFSFDLGSELQKPLAIGMIGTMVIGMLVSLFVVPLVYWAIYRKL